MLETMSARPATPVSEEDIHEIAASIFDRVRDIKRRHPGVSKEIDRVELEIRNCLAEIRKQISRLDKRDRDLVTVMVIHGLERSAEEVLVEK